MNETANIPDESPTPRPTVSAPSSRVTIAFPFSQIKVQEARDETREIAGLVLALAEHVAALRPSPETEELSTRARELMTKLS